jgi:YfiH family protein
MHPDWIIPDWPAPLEVRAFFTTRAGGVSSGSYASFNLGAFTDDDRASVSANRAKLRGVLPEEPRWLQQVHGARVIDADTLVDTPQADACFARQRRTVCAILVADCLPILFCDRSGTVVAAAHAGWRGLAAAVIENTVAAITRNGVKPRDLLAWIGPGIGPTAFEVGDDVYHAYTQQDSDCVTAFQRRNPGKWLADLPLLARRALQRSHVRHIYGGELCTYTQSERFYSYRRDRTTGRMGAFIWLE